MTSKMDSLPPGTQIIRKAILRYPVTLPDGTELMSAGTVVTREAIQQLIHQKGNRQYRNIRLFDHGSVYPDLLKFCRKPPYDQIFSDRHRMAEILDLMRQVELLDPLVTFLDVFKKNDLYTYRHILVVFALSTLMAQDLITEPAVLAHNVLAATAHDIGKICVPMSILKKNTPLTHRERDHLRHHALAGYVLLSFFLDDPDHPTAVTARDHHERRDGSGYPSGVPLKDPLVEIVAVSDVFDALIAQRPYRKSSYDLRTALEEITHMAMEGRFRWEAVRALVGLNRWDRPHFESCKVSVERRGTPPADNMYQERKGAPPIIGWVKRRDTSS